MECNFPKMADIKGRTFVKGAKEKPLRQEQHGLAGKFMHRNRSEKNNFTSVHSWCLGLKAWWILLSLIVDYYISSYVENCVFKGGGWTRTNQEQKE